MFCYRCKYKYIFANPRFLQENIFVWGQESRCGVASAFLHCRPFFSPCHSRLRAGILGGFMRGIALHYCLAGVHPRRRLPRPRVGARDDGAVAPFVLSFRTFSPCHPGLRAGILGSLMRGIALRCRLAIVILACASQGSLTRQLGGGSHPSVLPHQPQSVIPHLMRDPVWPCARYCIALLPSLPPPPRMPARRPA